MGRKAFKAGDILRGPLLQAPEFGHNPDSFQPYGLSALSNPVKKRA